MTSLQPSVHSITPYPGRWPSFSISHRWSSPSRAHKHETFLCPIRLRKQETTLLFDYLQIFGGIRDECTEVREDCRCSNVNLACRRRLWRGLCSIEDHCGR